ncbi:MAG: ATP-grasp domain-containing protein [Methanomicrobiales archaeon]|nr:ATP-grasp domain-containing protein [Methanomicrobiales archaeon]
MKAFLAEYTVFHDPALAPEGKAMLDVLEGSFSRCGYEVVKPEQGNLEEEITRLAPECDVGLVIAPDPLLARFTRILEGRTHNLGCDSMSAAVCANKEKTGKILTAHGIRVPREARSGLRVVKPIQGCGAQGVRLSRDSPLAGEFAQEYIEGEHCSVSILAGRVVGEACLYFSGKPPIALALNRQDIEIVKGAFYYRGGETPLHPSWEKEAVDTAIRTVGVLGCQGYIGVDLVVDNHPYVVDVNPRITTSLVGIAAVMEEEIADLLVRASRGDVPSEVHHQGRVRFSKGGEVVRL